MPSAPQSRIFVRNATVLDAAILDPVSGPRGASWYVDVSWQGSLNDEGYVLDFALAKRAAKDTIDRLFDHRMFVAKSAICRETDSEGNARSKVSVGEFALDTYPQALSELSDTVLEALCTGDFRPLEAEIAAAIKANGPRNVEAVTVTLRGHEQSAAKHYFTYTHSLRLHAGNCQRFHGHANVVEVFDSTGALHEEESVRAAHALNGRYLVAPCYVVPAPHPETKGIAHVSYLGSQGQVNVALLRERLLVIPEEASIENIAQYLATELGLAPGWQVHAFEGLAKGAVAPLT